MKISKILQELSNKLQGGSDDSEVPMAISDLKAIADMASKLAEHLMQEQPQELEGWVQAKITKAADYVNAVYKYHVYSGHDCGCGSAMQGNGLAEGVIRVFGYAKPYNKPDTNQLRAKADDFIKKLVAKNYTTHTGADVIYFPEYKNVGSCFGVLVGSDTIFIQPIDSDKIYKVSEELLARFMKDGRLEGYLLKGSMNEGVSTCCGKCGHKHVKGTSCPKPFLTGARHCRNRK